jgi:hypothetical protein
MGVRMISRFSLRKTASKAAAELTVAIVDEEAKWRRPLGRLEQRVTVRVVETELLL